MANNKKEEQVVFETNDLKGIIIAWVKDSTSNPETYLTKEGMAYLNGYVQANNTISLIKSEKYNELLANYEELIGKYEVLKKENEDLRSRKNIALMRVKELKEKRNWFKW